MPISGKDLDLLSGLLSAAQLRQEMITNNLANVETPGWTRKRVEFESLLAKAIEKPGFDPGSIAPQVVEDVTTPGRPDGNNVHLEEEMNALRENKLLYQTYTALLAHRFSAVDAAIREG